MNNEQMKPNRFGRWADARKRLNFILSHLEQGHVITITTALKSTQYNKKHASMFKATKSGLYVQRGQSWDCIDYCKISAWS